MRRSMSSRGFVFARFTPSQELASSSSSLVALAMAILLSMHGENVTFCCPGSRRANQTPRRSAPGHTRLRRGHMTICNGRAKVLVSPAYRCTTGAALMQCSPIV